MESAAELHEARVLRARIEIREAEMAALSGDVPPADRARLAEEIERLKGDYRRILSRQADEDYSRRRAEWRTQQAACGGGHLLSSGFGGGHFAVEEGLVGRSSLRAIAMRLRVRKSSKGW